MLLNFLETRKLTKSLYSSVTASVPKVSDVVSFWRYLSILYETHINILLGTRFIINFIDNRFEC